MEIDANYKVISERLVIRPYQEGDVVAYQGFFEEMGGVKMSLWHASEAVRDKSAMFGPRASVYLAAFDKAASGVIHSHISLTPYEHRVRAIGYGTRPTSQNKGYMREALSSLVNDVFARQILDGMVADVRVDNVNSRRVLAGAKFKPDMTRRERDGWIHLRR